MTGPLILHGVVPAGVPCPQMPAHLEVRSAGLRALLGAAGPLAGSGGGDDREALAAVLRRHHALLARAAAAGEVLPMRFGTLVADRDGASQLLARRAAALRAGLDRLAGRAQYLLTLTVPERAPAPEQATGRDYLRARAAARVARRTAEERAAFLAAEARDILASPAGAELRTEPAGQGGGGAARRIVALLPRAAVPGLADRLGALPRGCSGTELALSGPWPPYDFVAIEAEEAA